MSALHGTQQRIEPGQRGHSHRPKPGGAAVEATDADRAHVLSVVQAAGSSFYGAMRTLPKDRRDAMFAIYAFCREIDDIALRAMDVSAEISLRTAQPEVAMRLAEEILSREPFHESGYQRLMLAHAARGNRAEAIRVFHRCREILKEDLGVSPSAETEALYRKLLKES